MTAEVSLKQVGFFQTAQDLEAAARPMPQSWESLAVRYLKEGMAVVFSPGWSHDLLQPTLKISQFSILTDGKWLWPNSLAYYVSTYHVNLPQEFVEHMARAGWVVRQLDESELDGISEQLHNQNDAS